MKYTSDVLIIGAGGAGLTAALHAKKNGANVIVITKEYATRSQTCMAQGGINASFGNVENDNVESHVQNTLKSAHGEANEKAIRFMCEEAVGAVQWLDSLGVCFSRTKDAKIAQRTLGGASAPRACYAQDYTGLKILHTLHDQALKQDITIHNERYLLELVKNEQGEVCGAEVLNIRTSEIEIYQAGAVVLASGGYSKVYGENSTNSTASTGDGISVASRAGATLIDMEFIQFHPTALKNSSILISESARGAGGFLVNSKGKRFTNELAPRDEVSRAIHKEIQKGEDIFLDIRHLGEIFIQENLPQERKLAQLYEDIDPLYSLIPIKPVAHYTMGGILVDANSQTNLKGLFACGECANHRVHGANRLGGNSLLEIIVFGKEAGFNAAKYAQEKQTKNEKMQSICQIDYLLEQGQTTLCFYEARDFIADLLYENVGIIRTKTALQEAKNKIKNIQNNMHKYGVVDISKEYNINLVEFLEFKNIVSVCEQIIDGALKREVSCGAHYIQK